MVGIYVLINSIFENKNNKEPKNKNISSICQQNVGRVPFWANNYYRIVIKNKKNEANKDDSWIPHQHWFIRTKSKLIFCEKKRIKTKKAALHIRRLQ